MILNERTPNFQKTIFFVAMPHYLKRSGTVLPVPSVFSQTVVKKSKSLRNDDFT